MHQHIEPDFLLDAHGLLGFGFKESVVAPLVERPFLNAARASRTSLVCGKEPMVVVGYAGSLKRARCLSRRIGNGAARSRAIGCAVRDFTDCLWMRGAALCAATAAALASNAILAAPLPCFMSIVRAVTSASFCLLKASHDLSSASSCVSPSRSTGVWSSEQEGAISSRSGPILS